MRSLLTCLFVLFNQVGLSQPQDCGDTGLKDPAAVLKLHNEVRQGVAQRQFAHSDGAITYSKIGSKNMFALDYDCALQGIAYASVVNCRCDKTFVDAYDYSISCEKTILGSTKTTKIQEAYETTIKEWRDDAKNDIPLPLSAATYKNVPATFANSISDDLKSLRMGCAHRLCDKRVLIACVYSRKPQGEQPLYIEASTKTGCTAKKCKELVPEAKCDSSCGLCVTDKHVANVAI
ncbi:unnamed protein product [Cylicocyclus nassatus]|uniref:SCP domain-containing protein n=1 Tax=Cylicocyclus nassatus TaxID=53992 RepID=A0AA36GNV6_CYLNA|nr:unnamed protein product [Cylicocyclus nassatus]